jgi:ubiquinone/menaquinone biosynthesis C-methylase UbiE
MTQSWQLFDHLAPTYDSVVPFFAELGGQLVDFASPATGARVLDVGAGTGAVSRAALARGCRVTAVDAAPKMVEKLSAELPGITAARMDAERLEFPDDSFDAVFAAFVVHTVADPAATVAQLHRVLVAGGTVAISSPAPAATTGEWQRFDEIVAGYAPAGSSLAGSPKVDVPGLLADAGFRAVEPGAGRVRIPVAEPEIVWQWLMSQGFAGFVRSLGAERAGRLREEIMAEMRRMHESGGIVLDRGAVFVRAVK